MSDSVEVMCDGVLFATIVRESLPGVQYGRTAAGSSKESDVQAATADFPTPEKPKRKRRSKRETIEVED